jgi:hypothetical protein
MSNPHYIIFDKYSLKSKPVLVSDDILIEDSPLWQYYPVVLNNRFAQQFPTKLIKVFKDFYENKLPFAVSYVCFQPGFETNIHTDSEFTATFCTRVLTVLNANQLNLNDIYLEVDGIRQEFTNESLYFNASLPHRFINKSSANIIMLIEDYQHSELPSDWAKNSEIFFNYFTNNGDWPE